MRRSRDIFTHVEAGSIDRKSRYCKKSPKDDNNLTFDLDGFGVCKSNSMEIRLAILRSSPMDG